MTMLTDAAKDTESEIKVMDVAELVLAALE
jgi:hypothetical protein